MPTWVTKQFQAEVAADDFGEQADAVISSTLDGLQVRPPRAPAVPAPTAPTSFAIPSVADLTRDWIETPGEPDAPQAPAAPASAPAAAPAPAPLTSFSIPNPLDLVRDWLPEPTPEQRQQANAYSLESAGMAQGAAPAAPRPAQASSGAPAAMPTGQPLAAMSGTYDQSHDGKLRRIGQVARESGLDDEGARILQAVATTEGGLGGAIGDNGKSRGPYQFYEGGQMPAFRSWLQRQGIQGDPNQLVHDVDLATRFAATTYLGDTIRRGRASGLSGADLATYVQRYGQVSVNPEKTGANYRALFGGGRDPFAATDTSGAGSPSPSAAARQPSGAGAPAPEGALSAGDLSPNQFEIGLTKEQAYAACGPAAAIAFARKKGRYPTGPEAVALATEVGWTTGGGMAGTQSQVRLLEKMGVAAKLVPGMDWEKVKADLARGNPVIFDTTGGAGNNGHYFVVQGYDPKTGKFDLGGSAKALTASRGNSWYAPHEIANLGFGTPRNSIYMDDPDTPQMSAVAGRAPATPKTEAVVPAPLAKAVDSEAVAQAWRYSDASGLTPTGPLDAAPMAFKQGAADEAAALLPGDGGTMPSTGSAGAASQPSAGESRPGPSDVISSSSQPLAGASAPAMPPARDDYARERSYESPTPLGPAAPPNATAGPDTPLADLPPVAGGFEPRRDAPLDAPPTIPGGGYQIPSAPSGLRPPTPAPVDATYGPPAPADNPIARGIDAVGAVLPGPADAREAVGPIPPAVAAAGRGETVTPFGPFGGPAWNADVAQGSADAVIRSLGGDPSTLLVNLEVGGVPIRMTLSDAVQNFTDPAWVPGAGVLDVASDALIRKALPYLGRAARAGAVVVLDNAKAGAGAVREGWQQGRQVARDLNAAAPSGTVAPGTLGVSPGQATDVADEFAGARRMYHGTAGAFDRPDPGRFDGDGLYGPGYYLTSDPRVASSYSDARATPAPLTSEQVAGTLRDIAQRVDTVSPEASAFLREEADVVEQYLSGRPLTRNDISSRVYIAGTKTRDDAARDAVEAAGKGIEEPPTVGQNVRAVDVPKGLRLVDADKRIPADVRGAFDEALFDDPWAYDQYQQELREAIRQNGSTVDTIYGVASEYVGGKAEANRILAAAGYDGIKHRGGQIRALVDDDGNPIEHAVTIVFPESLDKIRNAFSGTRGGAFLGGVPNVASTVGRAALTDASNVLGGSIMGSAVGAGLPADTAGERVQNAMAGAGLGAVGAPVAGRLAGRARGALATPGISPNQPPRAPRTPPPIPEGARPIRASEDAELARLRKDKVVGGLPKDVQDEVWDIVSRSAREGGWAREQRRGVIPDDVVARLAEGDARPVDQLIKRGKAGKAYNAEESVALRNAVSSQANVVRELSEEIAEATANGMTPDLLIARRSAEALRLQGLVSVAEGAKAEAGRALRAYRQQARLIEMDPNAAIAQIRKRVADPDEFAKIVDEYTRAVREGADPIQMAKLWQKVNAGEFKTADAFQLYRRGNMLSGLRTFEVNFLSGGINLQYETLGQLGQQAARGRLREGLNEYGAAWSAWGKATMAGLQTLWHGVSEAQALRTGGDIRSPVSETIANPVGKRVAQFWELPDRVNAATDQFWRTAAEDWAVTVVAQRRARTGGARPGSEDWAQAVSDAAERVRENVHRDTEVKDLLDRITFSEEPGRFAEGVEDFRRKNPIIGHLAFPFVRTPANILSRSVDISPLGPLRTLGEVATNRGRGRANLDRRVRDNMVGTGIAAMAYGLAEAGVLTGAGPDDAEKRAMLGPNWQPYSVKIGDTYWSYANIAPFTVALASGAAVSEARKYAKKDETDLGSMMLDAAERTAKVVTEMSVVAGIGAVVKGLQDPDRYGTQWLSQTVNTLIPMGSALNTVGGAQDEYVRRADRESAPTQIGQNVLARIPVNPLTPDRSDAPIAQDPLGRPIRNDQTGAAVAIPVRVNRAEPDPVMDAFLDAGVDIGKPRDELTLRGGAKVKLTPDEQRRWNTLRGEAVLRIVPDVLRSPDWRIAPTVGKEKALRSILDRAAEEATGKMLGGMSEAEIRRRMGAK